MSKREPTDDSVSAQALTEEVQKVLDFHLICWSNNKKDAQRLFGQCLNDNRA